MLCGNYYFIQCHALSLFQTENFKPCSVLQKKSVRTSAQNSTQPAQDVVANSKHTKWHAQEGKKTSQIFKSGFEKHSRCMLHFTDRQIHNQCTMSQYVTGKQFGTGKLRNALLQAHQDQDRSTALFCKTLWHFLVFSHQLEGADTKNEY